MALGWACTSLQLRHDLWLSAQVSIYSPSRSAGQQGLGNTTEAGPAWYIEFHTREKWINPVSNIDDVLSRACSLTINAFDWDSKV